MQEWGKCKQFLRGISGVPCVLAFAVDIRFTQLKHNTLWHSSTVSNGNSQTDRQVAVILKVTTTQSWTFCMDSPLCPGLSSSSYKNRLLNKCDNTHHTPAIHLKHILHDIRSYFRQDHMDIVLLQIPLPW